MDSQPYESRAMNQDLDQAVPSSEENVRQEEIGTPALRFAGVYKAYGGRPVLRGVDLEVRTGEIFGLVGVNGAGKTTLIKLLLGFQPLDGGRIEIFGEPHARHRTRRHLAFLPERFLPPHYLTGEDFLDHLARLYGVDSERQDRRRALRQVDLEEEALSRPVRKYSKGMAQKLGLLGCFLSQRPLLVLDEPMSGLDPRARARIKESLRGLQAAGRTVFLTTHLLPDVAALCDRFAILHRGRLLFTGSPEACRRRYGGGDLEEAYMAAIETVEACQG